MAIKDCSSISSSDSSKDVSAGDVHAGIRCEEEDEISAVTLTTDNKISLLCKFFLFNIYIYILACVCSKKQFKTNYFKALF